MEKLGGNFENKSDSRLEKDIQEIRDSIEKDGDLKSVAINMLLHGSLTGDQKNELIGILGLWSIADNNFKDGKISIEEKIYSRERRKSDFIELAKRVYA